MAVDAKTRRHQELRRVYEAACRDRTPDRFNDYFGEMVREEAKSLDTRFSVRQLFEQFVPDGREAANMLSMSGEGGFKQLQESAELVDTSMFANIMGQITYTATMNGFNTPGLIGDQLVETIQTSFNGERIPGIGRVGDDLDVVNEGDPYPNATFGEEYIDTPETIKRGLILNITREAIFFDRTGLLVQEAQRCGERVAVNREKRILDVVCGIVTIFRRNGQSAVATYQSDNQLSNTLSDWTSIDTAQQKFNTMTDPTTGELISIDITQVLVPKALAMLARRIKTASMTRQATNSGNNQTYVNGNSVDTDFEILTGQYVASRVGNSTTWFAGQFKKAFVYMQNWPLTVINSGEEAEVGFTRDIVARYRVSERGAAAVRERLYAVKNT